MEQVNRIRTWVRGVGPRKIIGALLILGMLTGLGMILKYKKINLPIISDKPDEQVETGWEKMSLPNREAAFFVLKPKTESKYGVLPKQTFVLTCRKPVSQEFVASHLKSEVNFRIEKVSAQEFNLIPLAEIKPSQLLKVFFAVKDTRDGEVNFDRDYSFAFQTQGKFRVTSSIPGDKQKNVPVNTGIELAFSQDDYQDPTRYISIVPDIKWRGERHEERYAIVPLEPLSPKTVYKVVLKKGLDLGSRQDPITEDYAFSFQTTDPQREARIIPEISLAETFIQTSTSTPPAVKAYTYNLSSEQNIRTEIYKFESGEQFMASRQKLDTQNNYWWEYYAEDDPVDVSGLNKIASVDIKSQEKENTTFLQLPEPLPSGLYLVKFVWADGKRLQQLWVQSTDLAAYTSVGRNQTLVWVNNLSNGKPINGAKVNVVGGSGEFYTSDSGIAVFGTPASLLGSKNTGYLRISAPEGNQPLYLPVRADGDQTKSADDYWAYLYHERSLYHPTDRVDFWGVIKDRDSGLAAANIRVKLIMGYGDNEREYAAGNYYPAGDGSYFGNLAFNELPEGWYRLVAEINGLVINNASLQIQNFTKPEMKIEVTADKRAMFAGEQVKFTAKTSFFDNTPATNMKLNISEHPTGKDEIQTTNRAGELSYTYSPTYSESAYYPRYEGITLEPAITSNQKISGYGNVWVYGSRLNLETSSTQDGANAKVKATVNNIDLTGLNNGTSNNTRGTAAAGTQVTMEITKSWYEKKEAGTYYDFVEKVTYPKYEYTSHKEVLPEVKLTTDGEGRVEYTFLMEEYKSYSVKVQVNDNFGHPDKSTEYFYYYPGDNFSLTDAARTQTVPQLVLSKKENSYSLGEMVKAEIQQNEKAYLVKGGEKFLFIAARRGQQDYYVKEEPQLEIEFENKHIPNFYLAAVIFTGSRYQPVSSGCQWEWYCYFDYQSNYFNGINVRYHYQDRLLDLIISPDKQTYLPGETAKVRVTVTRSGKPEAGAEVNLAVVDQALAAIGGVKTPNTLPNLYSQVGSFIYYTYYSHRPVFADSPQAEKGGGGGDYREIFKDTPYFGHQRTNQEGYTDLEFTLPDNLTTWILYAQSVTGDLYAGQAENKLVVSKDFFINNRFVAEFLEADSPQLATAGFGTALANFDKIDYQTIFFAGDKELTKTNKSGNAYTEVYFPFPKLKSGKYLAGVSGKFGNKQDGVRLPFSVIDSRLQLNASTTNRLNKGDVAENFSATEALPNKPISLVITDIGKGQYYYQLTNYCFGRSNRLEKQLAGKVASEILTQYYKFNCPDPGRKLKEFQNLHTDGGLALVNWGGSDLGLTLWAIYTDPTLFDKNRLVDYLTAKLSEKDTGSIQEIYAAWGLSLLSSPQLSKLQVIAGQAATFEEKVNLALAFVSLGETEKAREMYYDLLADYAYILKPYIKIQRDQSVTGNNDKTVADTASMLLLGSWIEKEYNQGMYLYLQDYNNYNYVDDLVLDLGTLAYIRQELGKLPEYKDTKIKVQNSRLAETIDFSKVSSISYQLDKDDLTSLKITGLDGKAEVKLFYSVGSVGLTKLQTDDRLAISRRWRKVQGSDGNEIRLGDILEFTIDFNVSSQAPQGGYAIIDHLPSGLKWLSDPQAYGLKSDSYIWSGRDNVIESGFYNSPWWQIYGQKKMVYFARAAATGTYLAEPAILQSQLDLGVAKTTDPQTITIISGQ